MIPLSVGATFQRYSQLILKYNRHELFRWPILPLSVQCRREGNGEAPLGINCGSS